jgi:predicted ABC-type transport system involved in lysophospholipase L1 biosynthesis ATPase subunit
LTAGFAPLGVGQQRGAALRAAMIPRGPVLLADEPTSGLDADRANEILELLIRVCRERRMGLLLISHICAALISSFSIRSPRCRRINASSRSSRSRCGCPASIIEREMPRR